MKNFRIVVMLNGAEGIDYFEKLSNLRSIASGLVSNEEQSVLYYNLETVNSGRHPVIRIAMNYTGHGYAFLLTSILNDVVETINNAIEKRQIKNNMTVKLSLFGFSEGATLARHFGMEYITKRLIEALPSNLVERNISIKLDAEYLFDSVRLPNPIAVSVLSNFRLFSFQPSSYYNTSIPEGTRAYHAVSLDDCLVSNAPALIDKTSDKIEEVWFASDHLGVGGGHMLSYNNAPLAAIDPLQYMVMRANQNGLQFKTEFLDKLKTQQQSSDLRVIHNQSRHDVVPQLRRPRQVVVKKYGLITMDLPTIHQSVVTRMESDPNYRPLGLLPYSSFKMLNQEGKIATVKRVEVSTPTPILTRYNRVKAKTTAKPLKQLSKQSLPSINDKSISKNKKTVARAVSLR